jgi:photosystem II stability/assembly factor-like uncharacterized protein
MRQWPVLLGLVLAQLVPGAPARANGRLPASTGLVVDPDDPSRLLVRTTYGVVLSSDAGQSWSWLCESATGQSGTSDPVVGFGPGGALLISADQGMARSADGGCTFQSPVPGTETVRPLALAWPGGDAPIYLLVRPPSAGNAPALYVSTDGGASFAAAGQLQIDASTYPSGLVVAPSDPMTVYVTTSRLDGSAGMIYASTDGGASFAALPFAAVGGAVAPPVALVVAGADARVLYVGALPDTGQLHTVLLRSDDGGATFTTLGELSNGIQALLELPDGTLLAASGQQIYRSSDGGKTFALEARGPHSVCLGLAGQQILSCGSRILDGYSLGQSTDGGRCFTALYDTARLTGAVSCPASTAGGQCADGFAMLRMQLGDSAVPAGCSADGGPLNDGGGGPGVDGGGGPGRPDGGGDHGVPDPVPRGCGSCEVAPRSAAGDAGHGVAVAALLLALLQFAFRRRRA